MVTQTWGCAPAEALAAKRPATATIIRTKPLVRNCLVMRQPDVLRRIRGPESRLGQHSMECGGMEALNRALGRARSHAELQHYNPAAPPSARGSWAPSMVPFGCSTTAPACPMESA